MAQTKIELDEAMRRTEAMLVRLGYTVSSRWTDKYEADTERKPLWSMALPGLKDTRVLLWEEKDHWRAVISVAVGKDGEYPIAEAIVLRSKDLFFPPFEKVVARLTDVKAQVHNWGFAPANIYSAQALARMTKWFLQQGMPRKAKATNEAIITGELNAATVSEALSIVQSRYASHRLYRLVSAKIWGEVYK